MCTEPVLVTSRHRMWLREVTKSEKVAELPDLVDDALRL